MNWIIFYLIGALASGIFISSLFRIDSFYDTYINSIMKVKGEVKNEKEMTDEEKFILDNMDETHIIKVYVYLITFLSWIGIILTLVDLIRWAGQEQK